MNKFEIGDYVLVTKTKRDAPETAPKKGRVYRVKSVFKRKQGDYIYYFKEKEVKFGIIEKFLTKMVQE